MRKLTDVFFVVMAVFLLGACTPPGGTLVSTDAVDSDIGLLGRDADILECRINKPVDLGPNVRVFDPSMSLSAIQTELDDLFVRQETNQFGSERYALLFKPGVYDGLAVQIGFYTSVYGLGQNPDDTTIISNSPEHPDGIEVDAKWLNTPPGNATQNFWRSVENLQADSVHWAVAQAAPMRRVHSQSTINIDSSWYGWNSGGYFADVKAEGAAGTWCGQQWFTRNSDLGSWYGITLNATFVGVNGAPPENFDVDYAPSTTIDSAPIIAEKPYLYLDESGDYAVFVPSLARDAIGTTWSAGPTPGKSIPLRKFYIAKPGDSARKINLALLLGYNLLFTPGIYNIDRSINIVRPHTVVMGLGYATLIPQNGIVPMKVADVGGVKISGLLFDAGPVNSPVLLQVGSAHSRRRSTGNPTVLQDLFFRIGGAGPGSATISLIVNQDNAIIDHIWAWRADHGAGVGWTDNPAETGLVVNGDNVTAYGLFVEHYQKYEVIWNGEGGRTYFLQNEQPYDPPSVAQWMNGSLVGYAAYKVADTVTTHEAWGLGSYCYFTADPTIISDRGFETPVAPGVNFHDILTIALSDRNGQIQHVINDYGDITPLGFHKVCIVSYP